jgi:hypothetical protein
LSFLPHATRADDLAAAFFGVKPAISVVWRNFAAFDEQVEPSNRIGVGD